MALLQPRIPDMTRRALLAGLPDFEKNAPPVVRDLYEADRGHQVFTLGVEDLLRDEPARPAGWRFLAGTPNGPAVAAHVAPGADGVVKLRGLSTGPQAAALVRFAHEAGVLAQRAAEPYELTVLRIPGVLVEAFWLRSTAPGHDRMIPYLANTRELELMRSYSAEEFLNILKALAPGFLAFNQGTA